MGRNKKIEGRTALTTFNLGLDDLVWFENWCKEQSLSKSEGIRNLIRMEKFRTGDQSQKNPIGPEKPSFTNTMASYKLYGPHDIVIPNGKKKPPEGQDVNMILDDFLPQEYSNVYLSAKRMCEITWNRMQPEGKRRLPNHIMKYGKLVLK